MTDRIGLKTGSDRSRVADRIARAIYAYAGRTGRAVGHATMRKGMALLPAPVVETITQALCREFAGRAGTQPSESELQRLAFLYGVFPQDPNLIALTFRVNVYPDTNARAIEHLLARVTPDMDRRDDLNVMRLFYIHKTSPAGFDPQQFQRIAFDALRHDGILVDIWRVLFIKLVMEKMDAGTFDKSIVRHYMEIEGDPNILYSILYILFDRFNRLNDLDALAVVVAQARFKTSAEGFAVAYFFLVSFGFAAQAKALEDAHRDLPNALLHPLFIKGRLAPRPVSAAFDDAAVDDRIDPAYAALTWAWRDAELEKAEIRTRLARQPRAASPRAPDAPAKPHLLVAVFGQMRFPEATLPGVRDWILNDFAAHAAEVDLSFAICTWRETGGKVFLPDDHIDTIGGFLSQPVIALLKGLGCCTISDIRPHCPRVASKILDQAHVGTEIDEGRIARSFPGETTFDVDSEAGYMRALGRTLSDAVDGNTMLMNQGRMLSRISAVTQILATVDRSRPAPTHVLFIRPDLCDLSGSLACVFQQMRGRSNWAVVDQDAYAQVVEGVGDRFILADRSAAEEIAGIGTYTRRIFDGADPESLLRRKRLEPHQMLRSLMFEASIDIRTVSRRIVGWNLFRGAVNQDTVLAELRVDVAHMADGALKAAFMERL
jgi:hypothetical protein